MLLIAVCAAAPQEHTHTFTKRGKTTPPTSSNDSYNSLFCIYSSHHHDLSLFLIVSPLLFLYVLYSLSFRHGSTKICVSLDYGGENIHTLGCGQKCTLRCKHTHRTNISMVSRVLGITSYPTEKICLMTGKRRREDERERESEGESGRD